MANCIYLRMPAYVAAFYRGLDEDRQLTEWEPFEFSENSHEGVILQQNLRLIPEDNQSTVCFGQRAWRNILQGKAPKGGKSLVNRDPTLWPSVAEICSLTGKVMTLKQQSLDYLCIAMPREVVVSRQVHKPNASYTLPYEVATALVKMLHHRFKHDYLEWVIHDEEVCRSNGITRTRLESVERFLTQFNIPVSVDRKERESLRRMANRWLEEAKMKKVSRFVFQTGFADHISQDELRRRDLRQQEVEEEW